MARTLFRRLIMSGGLLIVSLAMAGAGPTTGVAQTQLLGGYALTRGKHHKRSHKRQRSHPVLRSDSVH